MVWRVRAVRLLRAVLQPALPVPCISDCSHTLGIPQTHAWLHASRVGVAASGAAGWVVVVHAVAPRRVSRAQRARDVLARVARRAIRIETVCGGHDAGRDIGPARHVFKRLAVGGARLVHAERSGVAAAVQAVQSSVTEGERLDE